MKNLFLGLIATIMFGFAGNAQTASYTKSAMTVAVAAAKGTYSKGMSYKDWLKSQIGAVIPAKEEEAFLNELFNYISKGANSKTVYDTYNGKSLIDLAVLNNKNGLKAIKEGGVSTENRWCIICIVKLFIDIVCQIVPCDGPIVPMD